MQLYSKLTRRAFFYLVGLLVAGISSAKSMKIGADKHHKIKEWNEILKEAKNFPFIKTLFSRRSRRFGWGMEIPSGPLKFKSNRPPIGLDEFENAFIISSGMGVSGWHNGIPFSSSQDGLCSYNVRFTGRTFPCTAGIGNLDLFYTNDNGTYFVSTRNGDGSKPWEISKESEAEKLISQVDNHTKKISTKRIELSRDGTNFSAHNIWNGNTEGSTLYIPVTNVAEQLIAMLFIVVESGYLVYDDLNKRNAGELTKYLDTKLLDKDRRYPLSYLEQYTLTQCAVEMGTMGQNMSLSLQPLGLGGWFYSGINPFSIMGLKAKKGQPGLGFKFEFNNDWGVPNPTGISDLYQSMSPPHYNTMSEAVDTFIEKKFGKDGTFRSQDHPYKNETFTDNANIPSKETINCVCEIAEYIFKEYGKFPGTVPSIFVRYYVQAHRLETGYYDKYFKPGAYTDTHKANVERWSRRDI